MTEHFLYSVKKFGASWYVSKLIDGKYQICPELGSYRQEIQAQDNADLCNRLDKVREKYATK
jgi:hypothetical protein